VECRTHGRLAIRLGQMDEVAANAAAHDGPIYVREQAGRAGLPAI